MIMIKFLRVFEQEGGSMKRLQLIAAAMLLLAILAGAAGAQKRPVRKTSAKTSTMVAPLEVRAAREKVDNQLANVDLFIDKLGPIAQSIETLDRSAQIRRFPENEANKQKVIAAIRNLRAGLSALESEFRTKSALKKYLPSIQGITDLAAESEDSALAGRFVAAK